MKMKIKALCRRFKAKLIKICWLKLNLKSTRRARRRSKRRRGRKEQRLRNKKNKMHMKENKLMLWK
jgi:hypothetical protein